MPSASKNACYLDTFVADSIFGKKGFANTKKLQSMGIEGYTNVETTDNVQKKPLNLTIHENGWQEKLKNRHRNLTDFRIIYLFGVYPRSVTCPAFVISHLLKVLKSHGH